jgi:carbon starvation protein
MRDGIDFVPTRASVVFGHHFSSIAGAGPIVGPTIAAIAFGWGPALAWIILGSILVGGVHDFGALVASLRHRARSIPEIARAYISPRAYRLFLAFVWLSLVYVVVVFLDLTAKTFADDSGVALSSSLIILLAALFGLAVFRSRIAFGTATAIALVGLVVVVALGDSPAVVSSVAKTLPLERAYPLFGGALGFWRVALLLYCLIAAVLPVWLLLQPRDFLSSFLLYASLLGGAAGLLLGAGSIAFDYPVFVGWTSEFAAAPGPLFPILFITIACGACSGFHAIVSSGTTSKQIARESDARRVGYGAMLIEGVLAVLALLAAVAVGTGALTTEGAIRNPVAVYGDGMAIFLSHLGIRPELGRHLALLALSTFLLTTLDTCARLARFVFEEFFALDQTRPASRWGATLTSLIPPAVIVFLPFPDPLDATKTIPAWRAIWPVFGASNQLLAALTLLAIAAWLRRTRGHHWVATLPMLFMLVMTVWALGLLLARNGLTSLLGGISGVLLLLAGIIAVEAFRSVAARGAGAAVK